jgi:hypothetical protein
MKIVILASELRAGRAGLALLDMVGNNLKKLLSVIFDS